jgi:hypothetical protein
LRSWELRLPAGRAAETRTAAGKQEALAVQGKRATDYGAKIGFDFTVAARLTPLNDIKFDRPPGCPPTDAAS